MSKLNMTTPPGRILQGSVHVGKTTDSKGNALIIKTGPNKGQPREDYFFSIGIPKGDTSFGEAYGVMQQAAKAGHPAQFDAAGNCINPAFSWKMTDGDSTIPNTRGKKPCDREGYPGHWVLTFSGMFAPTCYKNENNRVVEVVDPAEKAALFKPGNYVCVHGNVEGNGSIDSPGIYLNHSLVQFVGYGAAITFGPDANEVFGNTAIPLPAGASSTPLAPAVAVSAPAVPGVAAPVVAPALPGVVAPVAAPALPAVAAPVVAPAVAAPVVAPVAAPALPAVAPGVAVAPAPGFLNAPVTAPAVAEKSYNNAGNINTHSQLIAAGWNEAQIATLPPA